MESTAEEVKPPMRDSSTMAIKYAKAAVVRLSPSWKHTRVTNASAPTPNSNGAADCQSLMVWFGFRATRDAATGRTDRSLPPEATVGYPAAVAESRRRGVEADASLPRNPARPQGAEPDRRTKAPTLL